MFHYFGCRKTLDKSGESIKIFCRKFSCHSAENFRRGESFSVSLVSGIEKYLFHRLMSRISIFCRSFFLSQCLNFGRGTASCFTKFGYPKVS